MRILLLLFVYNFAFGSSLLEVDEYTIAYYEKLSKDPKVREEFELNRQLAKFSEEYRLNPNLEISYLDRNTNTFVMKRFKNEESYLNFQRGEILGRMAKEKLAVVAIDKLAGKYVPLYSDVKAYSKSVGEDLVIKRNGETIDLRQLKRELDFIYDQERNSNSLSKLTQNSKSKLSRGDSFDDSQMVARSRQLKQDLVTNQKQDVTMKQLQEIKELLKIENESKNLKKDYFEYFSEVRERAMVANQIGQLLIATSNPDLAKVGKYAIGASKIYENMEMLLDGRVVNAATGALQEMSALTTFNLYLGIANVAMGLINGGGDSELQSAMKAILKAIENLRKEMHARFDGIETILRNMGYDLADIKTLQNLSVYKLNQITSILERQEFESAVFEENRTIDDKGFRVVIDTCDKYLNTSSSLSFSRIKELEEKCYKEAGKLITDVSYHNSISPQTTSILREEPGFTENDFINNISKTNKYGNMNLLVKYSERLYNNANNSAYLNYIESRYPGIFNTSYPNIKVFMTFSELFQRSYQKYGIYFQDSRDVHSAFLEGNEDNFSQMSQVQSKAKDLSMGLDFIKNFASKNIIERFLNIVIEKTQEFLISFKLHILNNSYNLPVDEISQEKPFEFSNLLFNTKSTSAGHRMIELELSKMERLQKTDIAYIQSTPWPTGQYSTSNPIDMLYQVNSNITHEKHMQDSFNAYVHTLMNYWYDVIPDLRSKYDITYINVSADKNKILRDMIDSGCVTGINPGQDILSSAGYGWCVLKYGDRPTNAVTDGIYFKFKFTSKAQSNRRTEFYVTVNPYFIFFDDRYYDGNKVKAQVARSKDKLLLALNRGLREASIRAREEYIGILKLINSDKIVLANQQEEAGCGDLKLINEDAMAILNNKLCDTLTLKRKVFKIIRDILTVYRMESLINHGYSKNYESLVKSIQNTSLNPRDISPIISMVYPKAQNPKGRIKEKPKRAKNPKGRVKELPVLDRQ